MEENREIFCHRAGWIAGIIPPYKRGNEEKAYWI